LIDFAEFTEGLRSMNINITNHEQHALMKVFDHNGDGQISMEEFYNTLAQEEY
jgi:Ca2+-binding EF-hand superfamily protein